MRRLLYFIPLLVLGVVGIFSVMQLRQVSDGKEVNIIPSVLINRKMPEFNLAAIEGFEQGWGTKDLIGQVSLVNVFGSWCIACRVEHPFLIQIRDRYKIPIFGIDWREKNRKDGPRWLQRLGNPYVRVGEDPHSEVAISLGVTGAPETFIVDKKGIIRYKQIGPIDSENWDKTIWPLIQQLRKE